MNDRVMRPTERPTDGASAQLASAHACHARACMHSRSVRSAQWTGWWHVTRWVAAWQRFSSNTTTTTTTTTTTQNTHARKTRRGNNAQVVVLVEDHGLDELLVGGAEKVLLGDAHLRVVVARVHPQRHAVRAQERVVPDHHVLGEHVRPPVGARVLDDTRLLVPIMWQCRPFNLLLFCVST